jgi:hypothetical protein
VPFPTANACSYYHDDMSKPLYYSYVISQVLVVRQMNKFMSKNICKEIALLFSVIHKTLHVCFESSVVSTGFPVEGSFLAPCPAVSAPKRSIIDRQ